MTCELTIIVDDRNLSYADLVHLSSPWRVEQSHEEGFGLFPDIVVNDFDLNCLDVFSLEKFNDPSLGYVILTSIGRTVRCFVTGRERSSLYRWKKKFHSGSNCVEGSVQKHFEACSSGLTVQKLSEAGWHCWNISVLDKYLQSFIPNTARRF